MAQDTSNIPFWRDIRVLRILFQILFLVGVILLAGLLYTNMQRGLKNLNLELSLGFVENEAGFLISEGIDYGPDDYIPKSILGWCHEHDPCKSHRCCLCNTTRTVFRYCPIIQQLVSTENSNRLCRMFS